MYNGPRKTFNGLNVHVLLAFNRWTFSREEKAACPALGCNRCNRSATRER